MIRWYWKDQGHTNLAKRNTGGKQQPSVQHDCQNIYFQLLILYLYFINIFNNVSINFMCLSPCLSHQFNYLSQNLYFQHNLTICHHFSSWAGLEW